MSLFFTQVLLAMHANVEDRGIKGDITPLMAAASGGYVDIVKLLLVHGADVNAQSSTGKNKYIKHHTHVGISVQVFTYTIGSYTLLRAHMQL